MLPTFSFLYDTNAMAVLHAGLLGFLLALVVSLVVGGQHRAQVLDGLLLVVLAAIPRVLVNNHGLIRVAHPFINLGVHKDPGLYHNFGYPVALSGLTAAVAPLAPAGTREFDLVLGILLVLGCLTPTVFYALARIIGADRRLAWVIGLLVVCNPTHILYSTNYDFFVHSVFFEVIAHSLLILFLRQGRLWQFAGFFLASASFYHCRPENAAIYYFHLACLLYACWKLPLPRVRTIALTVLFAAYNFAYQFDWFSNVQTSENHVITHLWMAPVGVVVSLLNPHWNHLLDWGWSPPYLLVLVALGVWQSVRKRDGIHVYALVVTGAFLAIYHDVTVPSPIGNSRFFLNLLPATAVFALTALQWLEQRWSRTAQIAAAVIVAVFLPYVPKLADFDTIQTQELRFFTAQVEPRVRGQTLWRQPVTQALFARVPEAAWGGSLPIPADMIATEFEETHLDRPEIAVVSDVNAVPPGGWLLLGASCYQFTVTPGQMTPECEAQLHDPRNRVVETSGPLTTRPYHYFTPWYLTGAYKGFDHVQFYLLQRTPDGTHPAVPPPPAEAPKTAPFWSGLLAALQFPWMLLAAMALMVTSRRWAGRYPRLFALAAGALALESTRAVLRSLGQTWIGLLYQSPATWGAGALSVLLTGLGLQLAVLAVLRRPAVPGGRWRVAAGAVLAAVVTLGIELAEGRATFPAFGTVLTATPGTHVETFPNRPPIAYQVNARGFRGPEFSDKPAPGVLRGVVIGDSFAFGSGVEAEHTIAASLQRTLSQRWPQRTIEVLNLGIGGDALPSHLAVYDAAMATLHPDFVVLCITGSNDLTTEDDQAFRRARTQPSLLGAGRWLLGELTVMWMWHAWHDAPPGATDRNARLADLRQHLAARTAQSPPLVWQFYSHEPGDRATLASIARAYWADPPPNRPEFQLPRDGHPNAQANALTATRVAEVLVPLL